ncbi:STAS domain-containing protein [Streptomyces sp. NPDC050504]|uniref:STAS domain-containing protein n=1 Tax=Streptomyces sp. NPDC050504 TaxID=3365618 RepID=UPI0037A778C1
MTERLAPASPSSPVLPSSGTLPAAPFPEAYGQVYVQEGRTVFEVRGEIDLLAATRIGPTFDSATGRASPAVVVDLNRVDFMDCSGLTLLVRARRRVVERDGTLNLVCARPPLLRTIRAARLTELLRPVPDMAEAFAAPTGHDVLDERS